MQARFVRMDTENAADTIASFYFKTDRKYLFTSGQYADITIPHDFPDNRGITRTMTLSSSADAGLLRFTTRIGPENSSSYKRALHTMNEGDALSLTDAMGDMVLPLDPSIPLIFVAGGVGIASYAGIIEWLLERREHRDITLLYAIRYIQDIAFQKLFDDYAEAHYLTRRIYTSDTSTSYAWPDELVAERLTARHVVGFMQPNSLVYISGSEPLVEQVRYGLQNTYSVPQYQIAFDYFDGYKEA